MSTIERHDNKIYFEFDNQLITKTSRGWYNLKGEKFNRNKISNFVRRKSQCDRGEVMQVRSILNRFYGYDLPYII